jgi:hypothetical protein
MDLRSAALSAVASLAALGVAHGQERSRHALGEFEWLPTPSGVVIAAPHGTFDANTPPIVVDAARQAQAGYLVARRFVVDKIRINVNRPTEGAFLGCSQEPQTERARDVYEAYRAAVARAAAGNALRLYVEVHGNSNPKTAHNIEVATVGITAAEAQAVKDAYAAMLARVRASVREFPELALLVEPVDRITYSAACAKKLGALTVGFAPRAVHFEFPRSAREGEAVRGAAMLVAEIVRRLL